MNSEDVTQNRRLAPTRRGYAIAAVLAVVGLVIGLGGLLGGIGDLSAEVDAFQRVDVPGRGTVRFSSAGDYTLYYETVLGGGRPAFRTVLEGPDGELVQMTEYTGSFDYSVGGHDGSAIATFSIETPGTYELHAMASAPAGSGRLAVGKGLGGHLAKTLAPALVGFLTLMTAAALAIVTAARRRTARRRDTLATPV